jgi:hypothetical protein
MRKYGSGIQNFKWLIATLRSFTTSSTSRTSPTPDLISAEPKNLTQNPKTKPWAS